MSSSATSRGPVTCSVAAVAFFKCLSGRDVDRKELSKLMSRRASDIDVKLLLFAIQRTSNFEALCAKRFSGDSLLSDRSAAGQPVVARTAAPAASTNPFDEPQSQQSTNPFEDDAQAASASDSDTADASKQVSAAGDGHAGGQQATSPFVGLISKCFEAHLNIYIESQDRCGSEV